MPVQAEKNDLKVTRVTSENKIHFQSLMPADMYFAVELDDIFTIAAYYEQPELSLSPDDGIETAGVLQFATDGTKGKYAQAKILGFLVSDWERGDAAWQLLLDELLLICRKAGIFTVEAEYPTSDTGHINRLRRSGFSFKTIRKMRTFFSLATLNQQFKDIFTAKIPESYRRLEIADTDKLSTIQHKSFIRHLSETAEWDVRKVLHDLKKPDSLKCYIAVKDNEPAGAIMADCEIVDESDIAVVYIRYMRTFINDAYCLLLLCKSAIEDMVKTYGEHIYFSAETAFPPGVKLIQKIQPETDTFPVENGILKVSHKKG